MLERQVGSDRHAHIRGWHSVAWSNLTSIHASRASEERSVGRILPCLQVERAQGCAEEILGGRGHRLRLRRSAALPSDHGCMEKQMREGSAFKPSRPGHFREKLTFAGLPQSRGGEETFAILPLPNSSASFRGLLGRSPSSALYVRRSACPQHSPSPCLELRPLVHEEDTKMAVENASTAVLVGIDVGSDSLVTATTCLASSSIPTLVRNNLSNDATPTGEIKSHQQILKM